MDISLKSLEEALSIRWQIGSLEKRLDAILRASPSSPPTRRGKGKMSPQARAKIAAAMRARWAKRKGKAAHVSTAKRKGGITAAGRIRLSQLMKARWQREKEQLAKQRGRKVDSPLRDERSFRHS
jgi:hypothetical protein